MTYGLVSSIMSAPSPYPDWVSKLHESTGSLHDALVERWGSEIVSGVRPAGSRIAGDQAATDLGVSRTVVREAIRVLESLGLVSVRRRVGATILPSERWSPFDHRVLRWRLSGPEQIPLLRSLGELRSAIEPLAARLAADRASPEQCGALAAAAIGMAATSRAANTPAYLQHDVDFHLALLHASGNPMLIGLSDIVVAVLVGRTEHSLMPSTANATALRLHGDVAAAVQAGDASGAQAAMRGIVAETSEAIEALVHEHSATAR